MTAAAETSPAFAAEAARRHARETVSRSGTSFAAGMKILPKPRREAMFAIYAFCREVDDIADEGGTREEKRAGLDDWRREIDRLYEGRPEKPTAVALAEPVAAFGLEKQEFVLMIEGMEMDAEGPVVAPSFETYYAYTRRVAGTVGRLSMPVFGAPAGAASDAFALSLADALQTTNILRDIEEDAAIGRLYLPRELLERHGVPPVPAEVPGHPGLPGVARDLAAIARAKFAATRDAIRDLDWRVLRPALLMMGVYETCLDRLEARGWDRIGPTISISKPEKIAIALRWYYAPKLERRP